MRFSKHRLIRVRNLRFLLLFSVIACGDGSSSPTTPPAPPKPVVTLDQVQSPTNAAAVTISGSTAANATLQISGGSVVVTATASAQGAFSMSVTLKLNQANEISVVATSSAGVRSTAAIVTVVHDDIPPDAPTPDVGRYASADPFPFTGITEAGAEVTLTSAIDTVQATADTNGKFQQEIHLVPEEVNEVTLVAQDLAGNQGRQSVAQIISDTLPPTVGFDSDFADGRPDFDGDSRVNIAFYAVDLCTACERYPLYATNVVDLTSLFVANDRAIGGGLELGGVDAGDHIFENVDLGPSTEISVEMGQLWTTYETSLDYEFPSGANVLTITVADSAGNTSTDSVEFSVSNDGAPSLTLESSVREGDDSGFRIDGDMTDTGGKLNCWVDTPVGCPGLNFVADQELMALLSIHGNKGDDISAGDNFGHLFTYDEQIVDTLGFWTDSLRFVHHVGKVSFIPYVTTYVTTDSVGESYTFLDATILGGGPVGMTGYVTDRAGNLSAPYFLEALFPATPNSIFVLNSSATPGAQAHVVSVGLTNFTPLRGVQFILGFDPGVMTVDSVKSTGRVSFSPFYESIGEGTLSVVLVDLAGNLIPVASDIVAHIYTSINANASSAGMILAMSGVEAADEDGNPIAVEPVSGTLRIP